MEIKLSNQDAIDHLQAQIAKRHLDPATYIEELILNEKQTIWINENTMSTGFDSAAAKKSDGT